MCGVSPEEADCLRRPPSARCPTCPNEPLPPLPRVPTLVVPQTIYNNDNTNWSRAWVTPVRLLS